MHILKELIIEKFHNYRNEDLKQSDVIVTDSKSKLWQPL